MKALDTPTGKQRVLHYNKKIYIIFTNEVYESLNKLLGYTALCFTHCTSR